MYFSLTSKLPSNQSLSSLPATLTLTVVESLEEASRWRLWTRSPGAGRDVSPMEAGRSCRRQRCCWPGGTLLGASEPLLHHGEQQEKPFAVRKDKAQLCRSSPVIPSRVSPSLISLQNTFSAFSAVRFDLKTGRRKEGKPSHRRTTTN